MVLRMYCNVNWGCTFILNTVYYSGHNTSKKGNTRKQMGPEKGKKNVSEE